MIFIQKGKSSNAFGAVKPDLKAKGWLCEWITLKLKTDWERAYIMELLDICKQAKKIAPKIGILDTNTKNQTLLTVADFLVKEQNFILDANKIDIENGKKNHMPEGLLDRQIGRAHV